MLICPECKKQLRSDKLQACPDCGCPIDYIRQHQNEEVPVYNASSNPTVLRDAANSGNSDALYWLAYCLYFGGNGLEEDEESAKLLLEEAILHGHERAALDYESWFGKAPSSAPQIVEAKVPLRSLLTHFDGIVIFDLETSGLDSKLDRIIEIAAILVKDSATSLQVVDEFDEMIALPKGERLNPKISQLTGITEEILNRAGKAEEIIYKCFSKFVTCNKPLYTAYNAQFDLSFLQSLFEKYNDKRLNELHALDALTVYKDRKPYPHKLSDAIAAYNLGNKVANTHHALDDVKSLFEVMIAMDQEKPDLYKYVDLFGVHPKYGINGRRLPNIRYKEQLYNANRPLYEL